MQIQNMEVQSCSVRTPSIQNSIQNEQVGSGTDVTDYSNVRRRRICNKEDIVEEIKKQLWLAGPLVCASFLQFCILLISLMLVGHLGKLPLSAASMATAFAYVTGFSVLGRLPNPVLETSVLSICLNTTSTIFMIPMGLGSAISTRVSNELGAGHPQAARLAVFVVLGIDIIVGIFVGSVLLMIRNIWGRAYSNDTQVIHHVASMLPLLALSTILSGLQSVLSGTIRGCGRPKIGAYINLGAYYLAGIPASIVLAFVFHKGVKGLWSGLILALFIQGLSFFIIIIPTNWEHESKKARERVLDSRIPVGTVS